MLTTMTYYQEVFTSNLYYHHRYLKGFNLMFKFRGYGEVALAFRKGKKSRATNRKDPEPKSFYIQHKLDPLTTLSAELQAVWLATKHAFESAL